MAALWADVVVGFGRAAPWSHGSTASGFVEGPGEARGADKLKTNMQCGYWGGYLWKTKFFVFLGWLRLDLCFFLRGGYVHMFCSLLFVWRGLFRSIQEHLKTSPSIKTYIYIYYIVGRVLQGRVKRTSNEQGCRLVPPKHTTYPKRLKMEAPLRLNEWKPSLTRKQRCQISSKYGF